MLGETMKTCKCCGGHIVPLNEFTTDEKGNKQRFWVCYDHNCANFGVKIVLLFVKNKE